jgi:hypothetical protein
MTGTRRPGSDGSATWCDRQQGPDRTDESGRRNQPAPLTQAGKLQPPLVQRLGADHIDVISPELLFSKLSEINVDDIIAEFSKVR